MFSIVSPYMVVVSAENAFREPLSEAYILLVLPGLPFAERRMNAGHCRESLNDCGSIITNACDNAVEVSSVEHYLFLSLFKEL